MSYRHFCTVVQNLFASDIVGTSFVVALLDQLINNKECFP
jgi:hypothetical protein